MGDRGWWSGREGIRRLRWRLGWRVGWRGGGSFEGEEEGEEEGEGDGLLGGRGEGLRMGWGGMSEESGWEKEGGNACDGCGCIYHEDCSLGVRVRDSRCLHRYRMNR